ncbi:hypothetical protein SDC9_131007 [bioreactor metagenome]|uniref:Uncharacterized protein n=1 Tax=bioreactor metagenome TaxID=1076179 RepID=A0A645D439_9ZZZZ
MLAVVCHELCVVEVRGDDVTARGVAGEEDIFADFARREGDMILLLSFGNFAFVQDFTHVCFRSFVVG